MNTKNNENYNSSWYQRNRERILAQRKKEREESPETVKARKAAYYQRHKERIKARVAQYRQENPEKVLECKRRHSVEYGKRYRQEKVQKVLAKNMARYAAKKRRMPPWLSKLQLREIEKIYETCPKGFHVDHIIPLQGKIVSGLHVPWNLQHLPAVENIKKSNKF